MEMCVENMCLRERMTIKQFIVELKKCGGFMALNLARGVDIVRKMFLDENCTVFLSFTANLVATGLRSIFADLVKRNLVNVIVTTGGSIDHDVIKAYGGKYYVGDFEANDVKLHRENINRLGNIYVPNENYELLEKILQEMLSEIYEERKIISIRELIYEIGKRMKPDENSFVYQAAKNNVPIFSPGFQDSALGLQVFMFNQEHELVVDATRDMKELADIVYNSKRTGAIILGGGISKHYTIASNLLRGGLDYAVQITTAQPYDGSLSGARLTEAISWGKVREEGAISTIQGDATIIFPLLIAAVYSQLP